MPGRSAAPSRTVDRIIASCASLVGCISAREIPRIMSALTFYAERRRAPIDSVCQHELVTTAAAGKACAPVRLELLDEATALTAGVAVVTKARTARFDCFLENPDDRVTE